MKEDIKYPAIGEAVTGNKYLMLSNERGMKIGGGVHSALNGRVFKNITREYLTNTYGKVESKEHAEFIIELAEVNDIEACASWCRDSFFNFYTDTSGDIHLDFFRGDTAKSDGEKLITIPMPPKEVEAVGEWPKVDSEFQHRESKQKGVILCVNDNFAWCKYPCMNPITVKIKDIEKPKTPEEELCDEFEADFKELAGTHSISEMCKELYSKYSITKKKGVSDD